MGFPQEPEWKARDRSGMPASGNSGACSTLDAMSLLPEHESANWLMASVARISAAIAAILVREGVNYAQSKTVFKAARQRAGLHAPHECRGSVQRLTVEEELRFLDQAYAQGGRIGLMLQTLLETGCGCRKSHRTWRKCLNGLPWHWDD